MRDIFTDALNSPSGHLAEVLLGKLTKEDEANNELDGGLRVRLDRLVDAPGESGKLARVRLAAEVSYLFERAPQWTKARILPIFDWSSPDAEAAWDSRKYSNYIGSPELFGLVKKPFIEMFGRQNVSSENLRTFAEWMAIMLIANRVRSEDFYPLEPTEARAALRRAGAEALSSVGHRLAIEMGAANSSQKVNVWQTIVGPVFQTIWPIDIELQSNASTFKLVQILVATGDAFPEAAEIVIPLIRPDDSRSYSTIFSIAEASEVLYTLAPAKMLDLIVAVVGDAPQASVFALDKALSRLRTVDPTLAKTKKFQKLMSCASA